MREDGGNRALRRPAPRGAASERAQRAPRPGLATAIPQVIDTCCVLAFVVIGRASHAQGETLGGIASTAWPFLAGLAIGWLGAGWAGSSRLADKRLPGRRRLPGKQRLPGRQGVIVWLATVAVGMILRVVAGQGTAVAFVAVALAFLGLFLLGWRLLVRYILLIRSLSVLFLESF
jgi:hypothetical protein